MLKLLTSCTVHLKYTGNILLKIIKPIWLINFVYPLQWENAMTIDRYVVLYTVYVFFLFQYRGNVIPSVDGTRTCKLSFIWLWDYTV